MGGGLRRQVDSRLFVVGPLLALVAVVSGCTGDSDVATEVTSRVVEAEADSASDEPDAPSTTAESTSTTSSVAVGDDEAQVLELVRRFYVDANDRPDKSKGPDEYPDVYSEIAIDPILGRVQGTDADLIARGRTQESYPSLYTLSDVVIGEEMATVVTCHLGRDETYESSGELAVSSTNDFREVTFTVVKVEGRWWISDWLRSQGDDEFCDPIDDWGDLPAAGTDLALDAAGGEAVAAFEAYQEATGFFDERTQTLADIEPAFEVHATRHEPFWLRTFYNRFIENESRDLVAEGWDLDVREVRVEGDQAQILACGIGFVQLLSPQDGSLVFEDSGNTWFLAYMLREGDGEWRVEFFWQFSPIECDR